MTKAKPICERAMVFAGRDRFGMLLAGSCVRWPVGIEQAKLQAALLFHERPDCHHMDVRSVEDDKSLPYAALYVCTLVRAADIEWWREQGYQVEEPDEHGVAEAHPPAQGASDD